MLSGAVEELSVMTYGPDPPIAAISPGSTKRSSRVKCQRSSGAESSVPPPTRQSPRLWSRLAPSCRLARIRKLIPVPKREAGAAAAENAQCSEPPLCKDPRPAGLQIPAPASSKRRRANRTSTASRSSWRTSHRAPPTSRNSFGARCATSRFGGCIQSRCAQNRQPDPAAPNPVSAVARSRKSLQDLSTAKARARRQK